MIRALSCVLLLLVAACEQGPTLEQRLSTFIGRSEGDIVASLGVPTRTFETEGRRFLQFESRRTVLVPQPSPYFGPFGPRGWGPVDTPVAVGCDVTFEMRDGRALSFSYRGNGC
jgi:hypothetical protein